ncbi:MAG: alpha/beta hydrolase [Chitinophagales bacterium]|nr:alpha/beta hydrolase [Chitinophagales bacterium]
MSPNDWLNSGYFFHYKDYKIFYRHTRSEKECVLLLHGFPTSSWDWDKVWNSLAERYWLLAPDFLGFGFSDKPLPYPYSIFDQADMLEDLISEVGSTKFHILAHDYGVSVAQELVARANEKKEQGKGYFKIKSVCFLNGGLFPGAYQPLLVQKILAGKFGSIAVKLMNSFSFERSMNKIFGADTKASQQELAGFWHLINQKNGKAAIPSIIQYLREREKHAQRWTSALQTTAIPLRLINGTEDPISGMRMADKYKELIPNPDIVLLDGIGHYPQVEAPSKVAKHYLDFSNKLGLL